MSESISDKKEALTEKRMRKKEEKAVKREAKEATPDPRERVNSIATSLLETKERVVMKDESTIMMGTALAMQIRAMEDYELQMLFKHIDNNDFSAVLKALPIEEGVKMLSNVSRRLASMLIADMSFSIGVKERHVRESIARAMLAITMLENEKDMEVFRTLYGSNPEEDMETPLGIPNV